MYALFLALDDLVSHLFYFRYLLYDRVIKSHATDDFAGKILTDHKEKWMRLAQRHLLVTWKLFNVGAVSFSPCLM